jgi:hypothetical protein
MRWKFWIRSFGPSEIERSDNDPIYINYHLSALRLSNGGNHAGRCLPIFLRLQRLRRSPKAKTRRLLRVLFLWRRTLSACSRKLQWQFLLRLRPCWASLALAWSDRTWNYILQVTLSKATLAPWGAAAPARQHQRCVGTLAWRQDERRTGQVSHQLSASLRIGPHRERRGSFYICVIVYIRVIVCSLAGWSFDPDSGARKSKRTRSLKRKPPPRGEAAALTIKICTFFSSLRPSFTIGTDRHVGIDQGAMPEMRKFHQGKGSQDSRRLHDEMHPLRDGNYL